MKGKIEIVTMLLDNGADIDSKTDDNNTPLMIASGSGRTEIVKLLLEKGADVNVRNKTTNCTALTSAKNIETAEVIRKHIRIQELIKETRMASLVVKNGTTEDNKPLMQDTHKETVYNISSFF